MFYTVIRSPTGRRSDEFYMAFFFTLRNERLNFEGEKNFYYVNVTTNRCHKGKIKGKVPIPVMKTCRVPEGGKQFVKKIFGHIFLLSLYIRVPLTKNSPAF